MGSLLRAHYRRHASQLEARRLVFTIACMGFCALDTANSTELMPWDPSLARSFTYKDPRDPNGIYLGNLERSAGQ